MRLGPSHHIRYHITFVPVVIRFAALTGILHRDNNTAPKMKPYLPIFHLLVMG